MKRSQLHSQPLLRLKYLVEDHNQQVITRSPRLRAKYMVPDYRELLNEINSPKKHITT